MATTFGQVGRKGLRLVSRSRSVGTWMPRCLIFSRPLSRSHIRAWKTKSAARMSTARVLPGEGAPERRFVSLAGSAENAACVMLCAALEITAKTVSSLALFRTRTIPAFAHLWIGENVLCSVKAAAPRANGYSFSMQGSPQISC